jgi:HAD superfamily hydrolase (TIGR01490 family)
MGEAAAFFDLDKTVIAKASMVAMGGPLYREGLISRWLLLRAVAGQVVYVWFGASDAKLTKTRDTVLRLTAGWDRDTVRRITREAIDTVIEPIVYAEALELFAEHHARGERVFIVSASPEEIVAPLAERFGADGFLATIPEVDERNRYTGTVSRYCYGKEKVVAMEELAAAEGIDLDASYAYSDSATDEPMLAAVGHPTAVNPDRELLKVARERDWDVREFVRPVRAKARPAPAPTIAVGGGVVALVAAGVTYWVLRRPARLALRALPLPPAPPPGRTDRARQAWRTFLAATVASAASTRRRISFFMGEAG